MKPPVKKAEGGILSLVAGGEDTDDNYQDRTPDNIEIIANNLRGDMRSMDERYMELAQMVGESAFDTPPEVLALMQPQLAQQMQQQQMQQQPAAPNAGPQGLEKIAGGVPPAQDPQAQMPGAQMPGAQGPQPQQPQQPGGIESLVADAPQPQPVARSEGSDQKGEISRSRIQEIIPETDLLAMGDMGSNEELDAALENYLSSGGNMEQLANVAKGMRIDVTGVGGPGEQEDSSPVATDTNFEKGSVLNPGFNPGIASLIDKPTKKTGSFTPDLSKFMGKEDSGNEAAEYAAMMRFASPTMIARRQAGSPPFGERAEPRFNTADYIVDPDGTVRPRKGPPTYPSDDIYRSGENMARSRPFSEQELRDTIAAREARSMSRGQRTVRGISNFLGEGLRINPGVVEQRLGAFLKGASKLPGIGKVAKLAEVGVPSALLAWGATKDERGRELLGMDPLKTTLKDGLVPPLPNRPDGSGNPANLIPPMAGEPGLDVPNRESNAVDAVAMGQLTDDVPRQELTRVDSVAPTVKEVDLIHPFDPDAPNAYTGENVPPGDQQEGSALPYSEDDDSSKPSGDLPTKNPGESDKDFRSRVTARAALYKELLGTDPKAQKTQAFLILAEAGLALAGATGRNQGERISKGLRGVPSAFAKLAAQETELGRAATTAAISAIEQEDRDLAKYDAQLKAKRLSILKSQLPRQRQVEQQLALVRAQDPNLSLEQATQLAEGIIDGIYVGDGLTNYRDKSGVLVIRGPGMRPVQAGQAGYIPDTHPFLKKGVPEGIAVPPAMSVDEIKEVREKRALTASMLSKLTNKLYLIESTYGMGNVITRAITSATNPIFGDVGPFSADKVVGEKAIREMQKALSEAIAFNPNKVSVYEQEKNALLLTEPNKLFTTPAIVADELQGFITLFTNDINRYDHQLNPNIPLRQLERMPLGSKNDPLPANKMSALDQAYKLRPNAVIYVKRNDGVTIGVTKDQWEKMQAQKQ